ncbi:hypothetical protein ACJVC5_14130 [Peredibacter sp. HCB2-198]|uniref:hypothetical protein n=1 Tax=Peredibacter sp. HCB2-198 TaxID=3383025 RepID=UPI0038B61C60
MKRLVALTALVFSVYAVAQTSSPGSSAPSSTTPSATSSPSSTDSSSNMESGSMEEQRMEDESHKGHKKDKDMQKEEAGDMKDESPSSTTTP